MSAIQLSQINHKPSNVAHFSTSTDSAVNDVATKTLHKPAQTPSSTPSLIGRARQWITKPENISKLLGALLLCIGMCCHIDTVTFIGMGFVAAGFSGAFSGAKMFSGNSESSSDAVAQQGVELQKIENAQENGDLSVSAQEDRAKQESRGTIAH